MPREKFQTLTESMFYILLCLKDECCGMDIMDRVVEITDGRVRIGPGTLYNLLDEFTSERMIRNTRTEGRRRYYILTPMGAETLEMENKRLRAQLTDYDRVLGEKSV